MREPLKTRPPRPSRVIRKLSLQSSLKHDKPQCPLCPSPPSSRTERSSPQIPYPTFSRLGAQQPSRSPPFFTCVYCWHLPVWSLGDVSSKKCLCESSKRTSKGCKDSSPFRLPLGSLGGRTEATSEADVAFAGNPQKRSWDDPSDREEGAGRWHGHPIPGVVDNQGCEDIVSLITQPQTLGSTPGAQSCRHGANRGEAESLYLPQHVPEVSSCFILQTSCSSFSQVPEPAGDGTVGITPPPAFLTVAQTGDQPPPRAGVGTGLRAPDTHRLKPKHPSVTAFLLLPTGA